MSRAVLGKPAWLVPGQSAIEVPRGELRHALLTTFDPPDPGVLLEELLPGWLGMDRDYAESGSDRATFLCDLQARLARLRGRIGIFFTPDQGQQGSHWLWRHVRRLPVGRERSAVQHAKLWLLHRGPSEPGASETLEVVVGSMNLTNSGLGRQVQAGWRAVMNSGRSNRQKKESWGVLPSFLEELGHQAGMQGKALVTPWLEELLSRFQAPDVTFVASVPGSHPAKPRRDRAWGTAGLRALRPCSRQRAIDILVPTVGKFEKEDLEAWARAAGATPARLRLAWIPKAERGSLGHPWATSTGGWSMSPTTRTSIRDLDLDIRELDHPPIKLHRDWRTADKRWLHAKLYWLRDGRRRRLLVTSANWSEAAWGCTERGRLRIKNFEFGVAFDDKWSPLNTLQLLEPGQLHVTQDSKRLSEPAVAWASAGWDGKRIALELRLSGKPLPRLARRVAVEALGPGKRCAVRWLGEGAILEGSIVWRDLRRPPLAVRVTVLTEPRTQFDIPVGDLRPPGGESEEAYAEVSPEEAERLELQLLEERYGGAWVESAGGAGDERPDPPTVKAGEPPKTPAKEGEVEVPGASHPPTADYSTEAVERARARLQLVTAWADALTDASGETASSTGMEAIVEDGRRLCKLWRRMLPKAGSVEGLSLRVAIDELSARLECV